MNQSEIMFTGKQKQKKKIIKSYLKKNKKKTTDANNINPSILYTVNGHKYSSPSILRYIFHRKPHFSKKLL